MAFAAQQIKAALIHLRKSDPVMKAVVRQVGPFTLRAKRDRFTILVRSIISQQISTAAAATILGRLETAVGSKTIRPESLSQFDEASFKEIGISRQKASYLSDLRDKCLTQTVKLDSINRRTDEEIIEELIQVKGIGRWTAEMFLIFCLGRLDVFPYDDLGIRNAIARLYQFEQHAPKAEAFELAAAWAPYRTVASWYLWRSLEMDGLPAT